MNKKSFFWSPLIILAVGITFICLYNQANIIRWIIVLLGVAVLVPALFNLVWILVRRSRAQGSRQVNDSSSIIGSLVAVGVGVWIVSAPGFFEGFMVFAFAVVLLYLAISDIVLMVRDARPQRLPFWYYLVPILMVAAGIVLIATPLRTLNAMVVLVTGIALTLSAVNRIIELASDHSASSTPV